MQDQFEALLRKHIEGNSDERERRMLGELLRNPENQLYLASKIDHDFTEDLLKNEVADEIGAEMFKKIKARIVENTDTGDFKAAEENEQHTNVVELFRSRRWLYRSIAVAASIALIIGVALFWNTGNTKVQSIAEEKKTETLLITERHEKNISGKEKKIFLPDGSLVVLADQSELIYQDPFVNNRTIQLIGKAFFKVFKDKTRPFKVISGEISTTALGTEFTVTAYKNANQIIVRLLEGRVVLRPVDKLNKQMKNDVYLLPGQEFVYARSGKIISRKAVKVKPDAYDDSKRFDDPYIPQDDKGSWYMFNNQLLTQVLDQLQTLYKVQIVYNRKDIYNVYFTGKYERTESLDNILNRIGAINKLTITKKDTVYTISK
jgi:transmembrane sensor